LEKVGNPNVLVNLVSRRVRQLNSGGGAMSRPLVADTGSMGASDIALLEIIEEKMGWENARIGRVDPASRQEAQEALVAEEFPRSELVRWQNSGVFPHGRHS